MSAVDLLSVLSQVVYLAIFLIVLRRTLRHPTPAHVDMAAIGRFRRGRRSN